MRSMVAMLVPVLLVACSSGGEPAAEGEATIITSTDGAVQVSVPAGIDASGIEIVKLDEADWPEVFQGASRAGEVAIYDLLPDGATFEEPVTVTRTLSASAFEVADDEVPLLAGLIGDGDGGFDVMSDLAIARDGDELSVSGTTTHFTEYVVLRGDAVVRVPPAPTMIGDVPDPVIRILDRISGQAADGTRVVDVEIVGADGGDAMCDTVGDVSNGYRIDISIDVANLWGGVQAISGDFPQGAHVEGSFITICSQDEFGPSPGQSARVRIRIDHFGSGTRLVPRSAVTNGASGLVADPFPAESVDLERFDRLAAMFDAGCDGPTPEDTFPFGFGASQTVDGLGVAPIDQFGCWSLWGATPGVFDEVTQLRDFFAFDPAFIVENLALVTNAQGDPAVLEVGAGEGRVTGFPHDLTSACATPAEDCWNLIVFP